MERLTLQETCRRYNISFKKSLGQNLLLDDNINRIMVSAAKLDDTIDVVEVGAGLGALTRHLVEQARRVLSVEIDRSFMPCLEDQFGGVANLVLFRGDILNHSLPKLIEEHIPGGTRYCMVSNLPYYITTPILFHFLESPVVFERLVVMVQDEVGERMTAAPGAANYGALALTLKLHANTTVVHSVPASCFRPKPKVDSCIVRLQRHAIPPYPPEESRFIAKLIRASFAQRRKTLRNSLTKTGQFGVPSELVLDAFSQMKIDPGRRPQSLSLDEFGALGLAIFGQLDGHHPEVGEATA